MVLPGSSRSGENATQNSLSPAVPFARSLEAGFVFFFENRNQNFFRRTWIGRALENDDLPRAQIRRDGPRSIGDVAEIRLVVLIQGRRDANDDRIHGRDLRIIGGGFEAMGLGRRDFFRRDAENVGAAVVEGVDLLLIDIEPGDGKLLLAIEQSQRQSDIAEADNSDAGLARIDAAFQVGKKGRSDELSIHNRTLILALEPSR